MLVFYVPHLSMDTNSSLRSITSVPWIYMYSTLSLCSRLGNSIATKSSKFSANLVMNSKLDLGPIDYVFCRGAV